jgi:hypothetical protein
VAGEGQCFGANAQLHALQPSFYVEPASVLARGKDCPVTKNKLNRGILYLAPGPNGVAEPLTKVLSGRAVSSGEVAKQFQSSMRLFYTVSKSDTSKYGAILIKRLEKLHGEDLSAIVAISNNTQERMSDGSWVEEDVSFGSYKSYHQTNRFMSPFNDKLHVWFQRGDQQLRRRTDTGDKRRSAFLFNGTAKAYRATVIRFTGVDAEVTCIPFAIAFRNSTEEILFAIFEIYDNDSRPEVTSTLTVKFPKIP